MVPGMLGGYTPMYTVGMRYTPYVHRGYERYTLVYTT